MPNNFRQNDENPFPFETQNIEEILIELNKILLNRTEDIIDRLSNLSLQETNINIIKQLLNDAEMLKKNLSSCRLNDTKELRDATKEIYQFYTLLQTQVIEDFILLNNR